jgi:hypothetical protein
MSASPAEILRQMLLEWFTSDEIPGGVVVGPAEFEGIKRGTVALLEQGIPAVEPYVPIIRQRIAARVLHTDLEKAERIARLIRDKCLQWERRVVTQPSTGKKYLVHDLQLTGGPAMAMDSKFDWEILMMLEIMIGAKEVE